MPKLLLLLMVILLAGCGQAQISNDCRINGLGQGSCSFTNTGTGKGSLCVMPQMVRTDGQTLESSLICSGNLESSSTSVVQFFITGLISFCTNDESGKTWTDYCELQIIPRSDSKPRSGFALSSIISGDNDKIRMTKAQINTIQNALTTYSLDTPIPTNLRAITVGSNSILSPSALIDPWGSEFLYRSPSSNTKLEYDLCSAGPDMEFRTKDDICNESD